MAKAGPGLLAPSPSERARALLGALENDPASIDLRLSAVEALIAARNFDAAIRTAAEPQAAEAPGALVRALRFQGGAAQLEAGRYAEASETFDALLRVQETAGALNNRGVARFRLRDLLASAVFERAGRLTDPRQSDISFNRCLALLFEGRAEEALKGIEREIEGHPRDAQTQLLKVWALRSLNRETERGEAWEGLMAIAPSFSSLGNPDLARRLERIFFSERVSAP
jgi:tetratricopeptide (TPR) repeat protein